MSQHDFNIANQTFPSFRADLNNALVAAATMSAGSSAPTTPYVYQLWFDTSTDTWKVRNSGNTAWISTITTDLATGNVGIGTSSPVASSLLTLKETNAGGDGAELRLINSSTTVESATQIVFTNTTTDTADSAVIKAVRTAGGQDFRFSSDGTERLRIDGSGRVGIGTSPTQALVVSESSTPTIQIKDGAASGTRVSGRLHIGEADNLGVSIENSTNSYNDNCTMVFKTSPAAGTITERMRLDSGGNLLVGHTVEGTWSTNNSAILRASGVATFTATSTTPLYVNRLTSFGTIIDFRWSGTTVGYIGVGSGSGSPIYIGSAATGLDFEDSNDAIRPINASNGQPRDNAIDLGRPDVRFDDIYATNGTIQTSDANEKQQIAALTDAEMTAAKAISALFKTFKWNSAVETKGDAARTHAGVIAQDVQAAMTAAGLDAGDYAFFISSTWWETQTEVPAVEAVDAVYEDVVIPAVLDDDGNEVEAERTEQRMVTEAVEAVAAYTRIGTYDTAEEAPDGATERTRMGIRYPELLAFIGAATEQRLSNIETRLAALEA